MATRGLQMSPRVCWRVKKYVAEACTLLEVQVHVIKQWYDKKDKELVETRSQYTEDNMNEHAKTHEDLVAVKGT